MFSINVDWTEQYENWDNIGRSLIEQQCNHKEGMQYNGACEKCGFCEDSAIPMMNYAYPLEITPEDDKVLQVVKETNCTVLYNRCEDRYYLALCGGGMDLSQDIALAYNILEKWIPLELALRVSTQDGLSTYGKTFRKVMRACKDSLESDILASKRQLKKIKESIKTSLQKEREKKLQKIS